MEDGDFRLRSCGTRKEKMIRDKFVTYDKCMLKNYFKRMNTFRSQLKMAAKHRT